MAGKFVACYYCLGWGFEADFSGGNYTPDLFGGNCTPTCGRCGSNGYMDGEELQSSEELEGESYEERQKWLLPYYEKWNLQKRFDGNTTSHQYPIQEQKYRVND